MQSSISKDTYISSVHSAKRSVEKLQDLSTGWLECDPDPVFEPEYYVLPEWISKWVSEKSSNF